MGKVIECVCKHPLVLHKNHPVFVVMNQCTYWEEDDNGSFVYCPCNNYEADKLGYIEHMYERLDKNEQL